MASGQIPKLIWGLVNDKVGRVWNRISIVHLVDSGDLIENYDLW